MQQNLSVAPDNQPLLDALVDKGMLEAKDMVQALRIAQQEGGSIARMLVKLGWVSERDMATALSSYCDYPIADEAEYPEEQALKPQISLRFMHHHQLVPVQTGEGSFFIIMSDPSDVDAINALAFACGALPKIKVGVQSLIEQAIELTYGDEGVNEDDIDIDAAPNEDDIEYLKDIASETPIIQFVNKVIQRAVESSASDIHIEPFEKILKVRYRVDGVLSEENAPAHYSSAAIISRIKIMAKLDIAERRLPQDGRIMVRSEGKTLDVRVSTLPIVHGESVVMRILDRGSLELSFESLGFSPAVLPRFLEVLALPHGIILVTGPTGSGKSTTLYTALSHLNSPQVKIITVEDPVEYQLEGVNQLPVRSNIGLDFATALRSIVRQDPDIIMIGEMRDRETAEIAIQSALTGHLVLSTLHTNSAAASITRLLDMGVENYLLISTINGILSQRLVRKLCMYCKEPYQPTPEDLNILGNEFGEISELYRPEGCSKCGHTGYSGRSMIIEWLPMTESLQTLIMANAGAASQQKMAMKQGMVSMFHDGLRKVVEGETSLKEVLRVTQEN